MARIYEADGSKMIFRRPSGYIALDTSRPMPALIGELNLSSIEVAYPKTPGEVLKAEIHSSGGGYVLKYHTDTPAYNGTFQVDLGAFTGSVPPSMIFGLIRIRRTKSGGNVTGVLEAPLALNEWLQWPGGSLLLEHFGQGNKIWFWRHIDIVVSGGRWKLNCRQGNDRYKTAESLTGMRASTASTFSVDLQLGWGVFR